MDFVRVGLPLNVITCTRPSSLSDLRFHSNLDNPFADTDRMVGFLDDDFRRMGLGMHCSPAR